MAECKSCGAEITWARNESSGKMMPFDATPDKGGRWALDENEDGDLIAYHDPLAATRYTSHFATCPNSADHRKPRRDFRG